MIEFNLLPDVKKEYIKSKQQKRLITSVAMFSAAVALGITLLLFSIVQFAQKKSINDLTNDIKPGIEKLSSVDDLNKILTIQNQLNTLPGLHETKPASSRIFSYLTQLTPVEVKIATVDIDFETGTLVLEGSADSFVSINRFADTLKYAEFQVNPAESEESTEGDQDLPKTKAFSEVSIEMSRNDEQAGYKVTMLFDPLLFDNTQDITLVIPTTVTTRSTQGKPTISSSDENPLFDTSGGDE